MTAAKRKISVSLDADLVAELESGGEPLSSQVNAALHNELSARRRHRLLDSFLQDLDAQVGPVDESLVAEFSELLS